MTTSKLITPRFNPFENTNEISKYLKHPLIQNEINLTERNTRLKLWSKIVRNVILEFVKNNPELENIEITWNKKNGLKNRFDAPL